MLKRILLTLGAVGIIAFVAIMELFTPVAQQDKLAEAISLLSQAPTPERAQRYRVLLSECVLLRVDCQYQMGVSYLYGLGVHRNTAKGVKWLQLSAANGGRPAVNDLIWHYSTHAEDVWFRPELSLRWGRILLTFSKHTANEKDTLAAMWAASNDFERAIFWQRQALNDALVKTPLSQDRLQRMRLRLEYYREGKCFRMMRVCEPVIKKRISDTPVKPNWL